MNKIKIYLKLRFLILFRFIDDYFVVSPYLFIALFISGLSIIIKKIDTYDYDYIPYVFLVSYISFIFPFNINRNIDQLSLLVKKPKQLFLIENIIVSIPYIAMTIYLSYYWVSLVMIIIVFIATYFPIKISFTFLERINLSLLIPDVEFIAGIRKYWHVHTLGVLLIIIGVNVDNINISIFGYIIYVLTFGYYFQIIENKEWIWVHPISGKEFIETKIKSIFFKVLLFSIIIILFLSFFVDFFRVAFYSLLLIISVVSQMLSKYAKYYQSFISIQIAQAFSIVFCVIGFMNPIYIIVSIVYFYYLKREAIKTINKIYVRN